MNLLLHGIGQPDGDSPIEVKDALTADAGKRYSVVLANPPFGRKSSVTMIGGATGARVATTSTSRSSLPRTPPASRETAAPRPSVSRPLAMTN